MRISSPQSIYWTVVHNLKVKFLHILELNYNRIFFEFLRKLDWLWKRKLTSEITQTAKFWIGHLKPESHSERWIRYWTLNKILTINAEMNFKEHSESRTQNWTLNHTLKIKLKKKDWTQKTTEIKIDHLKFIKRMD